MPWQKRFSTDGIGGSEDLLTEIFVLLPAKSVVRFKSVCKRWSSLISSEFFTDLHIQNHWRRSAETQHSFILCDSHGSQFFLLKKNKLVRVSLPRHIRHQRIFEHVKLVRILQSVNGLLLLSVKYSKDDQIYRVEYVVFNPTIKQHRLIHLDDGYRPIKICLIFDPSKSKYYKLAMTTTAIPRFSVYDSATHEWSHGRESPFEFSSISGAMLNLCSVALCYTAAYTSPDLLRPPELSEYECYMFESNQHLNILQLKKNNKRCCFRVCEMIDDKWEIRKENSRIDFGDNTIGLLGMIREESIEDSAFLFHVPGQLLMYRFSQDDLEVLIDYQSDYFYEEDQLQFQYALPFIHTFAPV